MKTSIKCFIRVVPLVIGLLTVSFAQAQQVMPASGDLKWVTAPASLPAGAKVAMLKGDLAKPGAFVFRMKLPAGYRLKPHSTSAIERIVVVSGTFNLGAGDKFDDARTIPLYAGYVHWLDQTPYFAYTSEETVLEIEGAGPFVVNYVSPADDPMNKKRVSSSAIR